MISSMENILVHFSSKFETKVWWGEDRGANAILGEHSDTWR